VKENNVSLSTFVGVFPLYCMMKKNVSVSIVTTAPLRGRKTRGCLNEIFIFISIVFITRSWSPALLNPPPHPLNIRKCS